MLALGKQRSVSEFRMAKERERGSRSGNVRSRGIIGNILGRRGSGRAKDSPG